MPDHVASAGAIIIDSLEWNAEDYPSLRPSRAYAFIIDQIRDKVIACKSKLYVRFQLVGHSGGAGGRDMTAKFCVHAGSFGQVS